MMLQPSPSSSPTTSSEEMIKIRERLKTRLALANFKREHGYEQYDLVTLEARLLDAAAKVSERRVHRPGPTTANTAKDSAGMQDEDVAALLVMLHRRSLYRHFYQ